jgi:hypothetical protein
LGEDGDVRPGGGDRDVDHEVAFDLILAGQPMARAEIRPLEPSLFLISGFGPRAAQNLDEALAAKPPAVAVKVERDSRLKELVGQDILLLGLDRPAVGGDFDRNAHSSSFFSVTGYLF